MRRTLAANALTPPHDGYGVTRTGLFGGSLDPRLDPNEDGPGSLDPGPSRFPYETHQSGRPDSNRQRPAREAYRKTEPDSPCTMRIDVFPVDDRAPKRSFRSEKRIPRTQRTQLSYHTGSTPSPPSSACTNSVEGSRGLSLCLAMSILSLVVAVGMEPITILGRRFSL